MRKSVLSLYKVVAVSGLFLVIAALNACTVKLVADYDAQLANEIIEVSRQVDRFYGELIETDSAHRTYNKFKDRYIDIEVNIRSLIVQNKTRPLNKESVSIAETTLDLWIKYKRQHKEKNSYKGVLAENHRKRFTRLFTAMSVAEEAKRAKAEESGN